MPSTDLNRLLRHGKLHLTATPTLHRYQPSWCWHAHSLDDYALLLTLDGRGALIVNERPNPLRRGVCLLLKPGSSVVALQNAAYPLFLFVARFQFLDTNGKPASPPQPEAPERSLLIQNTRHLESLADLIASRSAASGIDDLLTKDAVNMLLRLLVESATRHAGDFDPRAYEALRAIEADLARKWSVAKLAHEASLSPAAFSSAFSRMMNEPPIHYVVRRRMEEAKRQIQQSSLPIEEIAINLGYDDPSAFRSLFRRRLGCSPEEYRAGRPL